MYPGPPPPPRGSLQTGPSLPAGPLGPPGPPLLQSSVLWLDIHGRERSSSTWTMRSERRAAATAAKFSVYENPALSAALKARSVDPSRLTFLCIFFLSVISGVALFAIASRRDGFLSGISFFNGSQFAAYIVRRFMQIVLGLLLVAALTALVQAFSFRNAKTASAKSGSNLTLRQLELLGLRSKPIGAVESEVAKKPSKPRPRSEPLVPIHLHSASSSGHVSSSKRLVSATGGQGVTMSPYTPSRSPGAVSVTSLYAADLSPSQGSISTPWSKQQRSVKGISSEAMLEQFLADVDEKIVESTNSSSAMNQNQVTPPPTVRGLCMGSPGLTSSSAATPGTTRSTPLRPVRMSPGSQKYTTSPKKGEGDFPASMSMEQMVQAYENLGIYPHIEQWRDRLRQWFSSVLMNPLVEKIETSHFQVMQVAAKVGYPITISPVGSDPVTATAPLTVSLIDGAKEWQPTYTVDEDGLLHQMRAALVQARDGSQLSSMASQSLQQNSLLPVIQECVNAITDHQRLLALMKGDLIKGLLPHSSARADYSVQRVRELAEGTCLKNYEYLGNGEAYDKKNKNWTLELPTDSHLLVYLFFAFLEHPKWMLHVDPTSYANAQSSKNPLFLGVLPPKERFPEKYVAVISSVPSVLHPGACVLAVSRQSPPIFALYWDKKLQFALQGRTALWDAILLLCHRIKISYGGVVRGLHLGSPALSLLPLFDSDAED